ncbi:MAG TPA: phosphoribosylamine--glycine ligase [Deltaproteobacteria bacterium]|nr:MAG: phosphoribosylamine--glycine ligase [Deltaproteobacteria bacterium GWA2_55_82]OGQ64644.1 MAG: phosphoribosylamine--glycine ligase [Deltaproteobacteria bacterium RIFCSPLOWO2_02_FULL_55_12]OIJ73744.1 MAG: phosphoribosylamine--glycine ligase [Deltaproteobacteria bacterium GWC2_55_46]HBG45858.1 phosphoribosylamine--glycine ligase [Deltaproteobacteria bacterium]HCY09723.1 phosphoribosylamine--glycine ligase [Deltaproteobacteria bacterium]
MKVLIIGSGGREHALAWKLSQSKKVSRLFIAPGNPGTARHGENVAISAEDIEGLKAFALKEQINLTVVGPELPLTLGITDSFTMAGLKVFGPSRAAAEIEGSKAFSKELMFRHNIPTAFYKRFDEPGPARSYIETHDAPFVVKADGLAAGKGVIICQRREEALHAVDLIMAKKAFGAAGKTIIIEEFLTGEEASFLAITDGRTVLPLAPAQDHKAVFDDDKGPNTGGMGAYSPAPIVTPALEQQIMETVMLPTVKAMEAEGRPYKGILYAGLMMTSKGPRVLEFNCRFGDPETQPILMRMETDLLDLLAAAVDGKLHELEIEWKKKAAVCVVMAAQGYPGDYLKGSEIKGLADAATLKETMVFHAGTAMKDGKVVTSGGRVLGVTALGDTIKDAIDNAYLAVGKISWEGAHYRNDIGKKALR